MRWGAGGVGEMGKEKKAEGGGSGGEEGMGGWVEGIFSPLLVVSSQKLEKRIVPSNSLIQVKESSEGLPPPTLRGREGSYNWIPVQARYARRPKKNQEETRSTGWGRHKLAPGQKRGITKRLHREKAQERRLQPGKKDVQFTYGERC